MTDPAPAPDPQPVDVPFSPIEAVDGAYVYQWNGAGTSIFPKPEDLPEEITGGGGVNLGSMVGVLWGGMRQMYSRHYTLSAKVTAQTKQITDLTARLDALERQRRPPNS